MSGETVTRVKDMHYLGVKFHTSMRWTKHVDEVTAKAHRKIGMLWRNLHKAPAPLKQTAYQTIVRPGLEYASPIWSPWTVKDKNKILPTLMQFYIDR